MSKTLFYHADIREKKAVAQYKSNTRKQNNRKPETSFRNNTHSVRSAGIRQEKRSRGLHAVQMLHTRFQDALLRQWEDLPDFIRIPEVRPCWEILDRKRGSLALKRMGDIAAASLLLAFLAVPMLVIAVIVKVDSAGPVFYRQVRVTVYGRLFRIHKFRTMEDGADRKGTAVTVSGDSRVTRAGRFLRKYRLDELPQLFDILDGNMSLAGPRPEAVKYVREYTAEMRATLLLPAGITSEAGIRYKDEGRLLDGAADADLVYIRQVMPEKMRICLEEIKNYSLRRELCTVLRTVPAVLERD